MKSLEEVLIDGGVAVMPTDTIYGIVGSARSEKTVERIYSIRKRDFNKPCIILISSLKDIQDLGIALRSEDRKVLEKIWPGKVSVILQSPQSFFTYLHRGTETLSFRMPDNEKLCELITKTGPIIAPSANTQGNEPAKTIEEAKKYFGDLVDIYVDGGTLESLPSTLIELHKGEIKVLREGAVKL